MGDFTGIEEGQVVHRTGEVLSVPVGDAYLGRVVDPLGNPIDDLGPIESEGRRALELQAPGVTQRKSVHEPLQTGLKAIDSMIPIGRGQRQLIIGDRQTGKTAIAIDTILNQKDNWASGDPNKQVRCIYVAVGQKASTIAAVRHTLETRGALEYTTIRGISRIRRSRLQVPGTLHRFGYRPALDVRWQARPHHLRRPVEAGRSIPRCVPAAAPPAGT